MKFGADEQRQAMRAGCPVRPHDTGQRCFIGDGQRAVAESLRVFDQFFRMRGTAQEGKIGAAVKFGVGRKAIRHGWTWHETV